MHVNAHVARPNRRVVVIENVSGGQHEDQTHQAKKDSVLNAPCDVQAAEFPILLHAMVLRRTVAVSGAGPSASKREQNGASGIHSTALVGPKASDTTHKRS